MVIKKLLIGYLIVTYYVLTQTVTWESKQPTVASSIFVFIHIVTSSIIILQVFSIAYASHVDTRHYGRIMAITSSLLDSMEEVHPDIMRKPKLHTLVHLVNDMSNFGPAVGFATERFDRNTDYKTHRHSLVRYKTNWTHKTLFVFIML